MTIIALILAAFFGFGLLWILYLEHRRKASRDEKWFEFFNEVDFAALAKILKDGSYRIPQDNPRDNQKQLIVERRGEVDSEKDTVGKDASDIVFGKLPKPAVKFGSEQE